MRCSLGKLTRGCAQQGQAEAAAPDVAGDEFCACASPRRWTRAIDSMQIRCRMGSVGNVVPDSSGEARAAVAEVGSDETEVLVIGAGVAGLRCAALLAQAGRD